MADNRFRVRELSLKGRLRTADDPSTIGPEDQSRLENMRPSEQYPRGVAGMTKINTSALSSTGIRNGFHFRKSQPAESHLVAWTSDGVVWKNDTAIPSQGAFSSLFTDTAGGSTGRFANAPGGALAYANGKDTCLWGGDEHRTAGFIDFPATGEVYDYGDIITNTRTDSNNLATIHTTQSTADTNTMLLLHFDGTNGSTTFTDSSLTTPHTVTAVGSAQLSTAQKAFGTASGLFDGTGDYLTVPDDADFDFSAGGSDGKATIEFLIGSSGSGCWGSGTYFSQATTGAGTDYMRLYRNGYYIQFDLVIASAVVATMSAVAIAPSSAPFSFRQIAFSINKVASTYYYYLFMAGELVAYTTHTAPPGNYNRPVCIGAWDNGASITDAIGSCYLDEFRISNIARWTSSFSPSSAAYGAGYSSTTYIGSIMPLDGVKFTVSTGNPLSSGTVPMQMYEWNGSVWSELSITDNTAVSGRTLEQSGTVTWASTASTSEPTVVEKIYLYWYKMVITGDPDFGGITLSNVTVSIPFQATKDIWDGEERPCNSFVVYDDPKYLDYTTNVLENGFSSTGSDIDASTFAKLVSLTTGDYMYAGFIERMAGVSIYVIDNYGNTNSIILSWEYWNGSEWTALSATDGTMDGSIPLAKSGWVTWTPAERASEFKRSDISTGSTELSAPKSAFGGWTYWAAQDPRFVGTIYALSQPRSLSTGGTALKSTGPLYYYRASFSGAISSDVRIYHVAGIPAPRDISGYSFPVMHQNRPVLVSNADGAKNTILMGATNTSNVYNGLDAYEFSFGQDDDINAAASLFLRFGSSVQDMLMLTKQSEIHLLEGNGGDSDPYRVRLLSSEIGCVAPLTMATIPVGDLGGGLRRQVAIWESQRGIEVFDGSALMDPLLSHDIRDKFDPNHANYAGASSNYGFYDSVHDEYHWCPVGAAEWVFSFKYKKWYRIVRGTAKYLYGGIPVMDTSGNSYIYGFDNAGYVYRLENGTDFDGNDIVHAGKTGAIALNQNQISEETTLRMAKMVQVAKNTTANLMTLKHFGDTETTGRTIDAAFSPAASGKRLKSRILNAGSRGPFVHHEFEFELTTNDETCGCEPIYIVAYYDGERQDVR